MRKVLVLSASVGGGHDAMARSIAAELARTHPEVEVQVADGLDVIKPGMATEWREGLESSIARGGGRLRALRYRFDNAPGIRDIGRRAFNAIGERPLAKYVTEQQPDVVVTTFPYVAHAVAKAQADGLLPEGTRTMTTLIDPAPHGGWFGRGNAAHTTMFPGDIARIRELDPLRGVGHLHLQQALPPVDPARFAGHDRAAVRAQFGLPVDRPVVLVSGGSLGLGIDADFVRKLIAANPEATYAMATAKNADGAREITANFRPDQAVAIPFTDQMPALLATSDAAITNSGGMTTIEAFAAGTPVVLHNVVPGHGVDAAKALDADGIATFARSSDDLRSALSSVGQPRGELATRARAATAQVFAPGTPSIGDVVMGTALLA